MAKASNQTLQKYYKSEQSYNFKVKQHHEADARELDSL